MEPATKKSRVSCRRREIVFICRHHVHASPSTDTAAQEHHKTTVNRKAPAVVCRGLMPIAVFCWCQCLRLKFVGDDHRDLPGGRDGPIREETVDRDDGGQDISHLMDSDG